MAPLASIAIPTRNRAAFLARSLASYTQQRERRFELVIADDGSDDDTRDVARAFADELDLRYIRRARVGIAAARNAAIRSARGEVLIFTDDDRVVDPDFVAAHVAAHAGEVRRIAVGRQRGLFAQWARDAAYTTSDLASLVVRRPDLAPQLAAPHAELINVAMLRENLAETLATFELDEPWWKNHAEPVLASWPDLAGYAFPFSLGIGGNVSMRTALTHEIGLHDESFVGWGLEDTDFHYRAHLAGVQTVVVDNAVNYHQVHRRGPERVREWARNALRMIDKHTGFDMLLWLAVCRRMLDLATANRIALEHAAITGTAPAVAAELVRITREHLRLLLAVA